MVAAAIAVNMQADKLVLLTDVPGLLRTLMTLIALYQS